MELRKAAFTPSTKLNPEYAHTSSALSHLLYNQPLNEEYINVPFPPAYYLIFAAKHKTGPAPEYQNMIYDKAAIARSLAYYFEESHKFDLPRTLWMYGETSKVGTVLDDDAVVGVVLAQMQADSIAAGIHLTQNEARALAAFANSTSSGYQQGGMLGSESLMLNDFLVKISAGTLCKDNKQESTKYHIFRKDDELRVLRHANIAKLQGWEEAAEKKDNRDLIIYHYQYAIKPTVDEGFALHTDNHAAKLLFRHDVWQTKILPQAFVTLENTQFKDEDIFVLIPCLCDKGFSKQFFAKLALHPVPDTIKEIVNYIEICFKHHPARDRIENSIAKLCDDRSIDRAEPHKPEPNLLMGADAKAKPPTPAADATNAPAATTGKVTTPVVHH